MKQFKRPLDNQWNCCAGLKYLTGIVLVLMSLWLLNAEAYAGETAQSSGVIYENAEAEESPEETKETEAAESYEQYKNPSTGYGVWIYDDAGLLNKSEKVSLTVAMKPITEYGEAVYVTTDTPHPGTTEYFTTNFYLEHFGAYRSGIVYCVDIEDEYDYVYSEGKIYDLLGKGFANTIADNVYMYSANEKWYEGANAAFSMVDDVLNGKRIAQPMKYICNTFLGLLAALLINFIIVDRKSKLKRMSSTEMVEGAMKSVRFNHVDVKFLRQTKRYNPPSSSGGSHGGGHHSGGGGHHGGGGGHSH